MFKEWIRWIALSLAAVAAVLFIFAIVLHFSKESHIPVLQEPASSRCLKPCAFQQTPDAYSSIANQLLQLKSTLPSAHLPDLRPSLTYYGKNGRPDADGASGALFLSSAGDKEPIMVEPDQPIYMTYDKSLSPARFVFSPDNHETSLWIEVSSKDSKDLLVKVSMKDQNGGIIQEPANYAQFKLQEKPLARTNGVNWQIGKYKADATLLSQQKAKWYGIDRFLEKHGGKEFQDVSGKQRIDFGENEDLYSVFVEPNDVFIWQNNHWVVTKPGPDTVALPMLVIKKIDDRLMHLELWSDDGKNKALINLIKSTEAFPPLNFAKDFKFLSAKTRSQFVFEIDKEKLTIMPQDWLLQMDKTWTKLSSPEEIDAYVERKTTGYLIVIDGIERRDDRQVLTGTLFNKSRSASQQIEIPLQIPSSSPSNSKSKDQLKTKMRQGTPVRQQTSTSYQRPGGDDDSGSDAEDVDDDGDE